jgi:hypothetical protein
MVVFGGVNGYQRPLNDVVSLNLQTGVWTTILKGDGIYTGENHGKLPHVTRCKSCIVMHEQRKLQDIESLEKIPPVQWKKAEESIEMEGIYIFGGLINQKPSNKLFVLKFSKNQD